MYLLFGPFLWIWVWTGHMVRALAKNPHIQPDHFPSFLGSSSNSNHPHTSRVQRCGTNGHSDSIQS